MRQSFLTLEQCLEVGPYTQWGVHDMHLMTSHHGDHLSNTHKFDLVNFSIFKMIEVYCNIGSLH